MKIDLQHTDELLLEESLMPFHQITHGDENIDLVTMLKRFVGSYGLNVWFDGNHWKVNHTGGKKEDQRIFATRSEAYQFILGCIVNTALNMDAGDKYEAMQAGFSELKAMVKERTRK